jgi:hypothetical protein
MIAQGQVLLDETFDYSVANLADESSWTTGGTLTTGTGRNIITPALNYSNAGGIYYLSGVGKTMNNDIAAATSYTAYKPFTDTPVTTGTVYLSFLYKAGVTQKQTNSEVFGMSTGTSAGAKLWAGKGSVTGSFRFGTTRGSTTSADIQWGTTEFPPADTSTVILVVLKYDFTTETSSVYLNPTVGSASEPTAETMDNSTITKRTSLNNLWFRGNGSSIARYNVSGARVSISWADAVAAAPSDKLSAPVVGIASLITTSGFTANWTKVDNAVGYTIKVYSGINQVSTAEVTGQEIESVAVEGLTSGTSYTYKVIAISDGVNFASSDPSDESASFETLGLLPPVTGIATSVTAHDFIANWETVANATGYDVQVYLGTFLVNTINVGGQATSSLSVSGLASGTSYTFKVIAKGDASAYLDSSPSTSSAVFVTNSLGVDFIHTDFNDGTWGNPLPVSPAAGSFPSSSINEFILNKAVVRTVSRTDRRGDIHINDINIDKNTYNSYVVFPTVNSVEQIELHALTGTADRSFFLEEYNTGTSAWDEIGTYVYDAVSKSYGMDSIYVISISRSVPTTFRVRNNGTGGMYIAQVITRTTDPVTLAAPLVGEASDITTVGFTANWTPADFATGYEVFVYKELDLVSSLVSRTVVSGQEVSSLAITGLSWNTEYTYKVLAKGDGFVYYSDSYLSGASTPFTTLNPQMLTTPVVGEASDLEGIGFTANWTPVDFALGYEVFVYQDTNLVSKTAVSGQAASSLAITGLTLNTTYTYMVQAKGDSVDYSDSELSAASSAFTTLDYQTAIPGLTPGNSNFRIYPNPVSNIVNFEYNLSQNTEIRLVLYNTKGQAVRTMLNAKNQSAGNYSKSFNVSGLKNGVYFARFTSGNVTKSFKVVINR